MPKYKHGYVSDNKELMCEWDYDKNADLYYPQKITQGNSLIKINWICSKCNHKWPATAYNRAILKSGCPECAKKIIGMKNRQRRFKTEKSLKILFPDLAAEWDVIKNKELNLENIMPGCNEKVNWICSECGNEFEAVVCDRTGYKHAGCPVCNRHMHTSFPEQALFFYVQQAFPNAQNRYTDIFDNQMELDVFIPELNVGIEYDGGYWHSVASLNRNTEKYEICRQKGITLIRIKENYRRYPVCNDDCDYSIYREDEKDSSLHNVIKNVLDYLLVNNRIQVDIVRDRAEIKSKYIVSFKEKSLLAKFPELALEWHPTLNGKLRPDMVLPSSGDKVQWLCPKCGYTYPAAPSKRTREKPTGCPVCANRIIIQGINDLATVRPDLAAEWHIEKNIDLSPTQIAPNYSKKVWWKCSKCSYEYEKTPNKRVSSGQGCKECSKEQRKINQHNKALKPGVNDLASQYPELLKEWDYELNEGLCRPEDVTIGNTNLAINWKCSVCGYKWKAPANNRTRLGCGCKICGWKRTGEKLSARSLKKGVNYLASQRPDLLKEWDYQKNKSICEPDAITIGNSKTQVHWKCSVCGYRWCTTVYLRAHRGTGCRCCARRKR